jgi:uncharacterized cupredoxin-like copper-binding protein
MLPSVIVLAAVIAGCGGDAGTTPSGSAQIVPLRADLSGGLSFAPDHATVASGKVELVMSNPSTVAHGIAIEGRGASAIGAIVGRGGSSTVTVALKPGTYTFYCPVPGHRPAGMSGTLTVR